MAAYHITVVRENPGAALSDTHYYVILDAESEDAARNLALDRAQEDYPDDIFTYRECRDAMSRRSVALQRA